jgi:hypothetical protein
VLRWQPWNARLELSYFVLGAALIGVVAERMGARFTALLGTLLLVSMVPWVLYNQARPLVGPRSIFAMSRTDQYFTSRPGMRAPYTAAVQVLRERNCTQVGFLSDLDGWEYPLWALYGAVVHIEHVAVSNASARENSGSEQFEPCAVFAVGARANDASLTWAGQLYVTAWKAGDGPDQVAVLTAVERARRPQGKVAFARTSASTFRQLR